MPNERWRIAVITTVTPIAEVLTDGLRQLGHEPVAVISARRTQRANPPTDDPFPELSDSSAPKGLDLLMARDRNSMEPLLRATGADLAVCWGFSWRIPQAALDVPRLGVINCHPALLPRHRGPIPISWAFREGDPHYGMTWHRMDAALDTGGILAQATIPMEDDDFDYMALGPRMIGTALGLLPRVLERVAAGDPGDPQPDEGASWAGWLGEDYATVDWSQPRRSIHKPGPRVGVRRPAGWDRRPCGRAGRTARAAAQDRTLRPGRGRPQGRRRRRPAVGRKVGAARLASRRPPG